MIKRIIIEYDDRPCPCINPKDIHFVPYFPPDTTVEIPKHAPFATCEGI